MQVPLKDVPGIGLMDEELRFVYPSEAERTKVETLEARHDIQRSSSLTAETASRLREENCAAVRGYRWENQDELAYVRLGRSLRDFDFLGMLRRILPARFSGLSRPGLWGLEVFDSREHRAGWTFVCGAQAGLMPEYSTMYFDPHGLPTSEMYRGWRTVLLRLITSGTITEEQAHKIFGEASGPMSGRYRGQLYAWRNRRAI